MTEKQSVQEDTVVEEVKVPVITATAKKAKKAKSIKELTLADLKKESKKLDEQSEFEIKIGSTDYIIKYDKVFRKTKQRAVLEDTLHFFQQMGEENMKNLEMASAYTALLIVKHFTSLDIPDEIEEALAMLEVLVDLGVIGDIVNELPEDEVVKIYELLTQTVDSLNNNLKMAEAEAKLVEEELENEEVKELIADKAMEEDVTQ